MLAGRFVRKSLNNTCESLIDTFAFVVFYTNNMQGIFKKRLFHQPIKFSVVFIRSINPGELPRVRGIGNSNWNFNGDRLRLVVVVRIQVLNHLMIILDAQPQKQPVISKDIKEQQR